MSFIARSQGFSKPELNYLGDLLLEMDKSESFCHSCNLARSRVPNSAGR